MAKLTTTPIASGYASTAALNDNFDLIEVAIENTLSRDGTSPNTMSAPIDMNGQKILNISAPSLPNDPVRLQDIQASIDGAASAALVGFTPAGNIAATTVQTAIEELDTEKADAAATTLELNLKVAKTSDVGSAQIPSGTTAQRGTPPAYSLRGNSDYTKLEFTPDGTNWSGLGGASGSGGDAIFWINGKTITTNHTILSTENAGTFGPVTIADGVTVTLETGSTWSIV